MHHDIMVDIDIYLQPTYTINTTPQLLVQMCDSLGRAVNAQTPPRDRWTLPQNAYRLLLEFLRCEHSFCHYIIPIFGPFGWTSFRVARYDTTQELSGKAASEDPDTTNCPAQRRERARRAVHEALCERRRRSTLRNSHSLTEAHGYKNTQGFLSTCGVRSNTVHE